MTSLKYVDFDKDACAKMWDHVNVQLSNFVPIRALRDGIAIVGMVDIDIIYEVTDVCAVNLVVAGCELQVDIENESLNLQAGLNISPEFRAIATIKISRLLKDELAQAIRDCAAWVEETADAPDGFIGESFNEAEEPSGEDEVVTAVVEPDPYEDGDTPATTAPDTGGDNPY